MASPKDRCTIGTLLAHSYEHWQGLSCIDFDSRTAPDKDKDKDKVETNKEFSRIRAQLSMCCRESVGKVGLVALGVGSWGGGVVRQWWDIGI